MEGLFVVTVDRDGLPVEVEDGRPALAARSLANALKLCKRKLARLKDKVHTREDVAHYKDALELLESEWASLPAAEECATPVAGAGKAATRASQTYDKCRKLLEECRELLGQMEASAEELPEPVRPTYERLQALRRRLQRMHRARGHTLQEVMPLQAELDELDADRVAGGGFGGEPDSPGQHVCDELLNSCYDLLADCLHSATDIPPAMQHAYNQLRRIKNSLRKLAGKERAHTVEELQLYQAQLEKIDSQGLEALAEGEKEQGGSRLNGHTAAQALLKDCYDLIEGLMEHAVGLEHDAKALHHRLEEYRHHLEGMSQRPHTFKELLDVQLALNAVDDDRQAHAGVFAGSTMAGRACSNLLNHCYRMLHDLYGTAQASNDAEP